MERPDFPQAQSQHGGFQQPLSKAGGFVRRDKQTEGCAQPVHRKKKKVKKEKKEKKENKGSDKGKASTNALYLIIPIIKTEALWPFIYPS